MQKGELKLRVAVEGGQEAAQQIRQVEQANAGAVKATGRAAEAASQSVQDVARAASDAQQRAARDAQAAAVRSAQAVNVSSKQTAAALRMLPAQFSDIAVSLQGGQSPLTVLLQQGAQIKDSFGGVGAAARALGGYTLGLINPVSAIGTALGVVAVAAYAGSRETTALAQSVIATGYAAGKTAGQLQMMAASAAQGAGMSRSAVSGALTELVSSGRVGEQVLSDASTAAAAWSKATGMAVSDMAKDFAALAADPLGASLKLNESMNFLTLSTYEQIRALQEQGRYTDAADLAQRTYADTLAQRAPQMVEQLGLLERGWKAIKSAVGGAVDAMMGVGRGNLEEARLEQVRGNIEGVRRAMADPQQSPYMSTMRQNLQNLQAEESRLEAIVRGRQKAAQASGEQARQVQATARWDEIAKGHMGEEARLRAELMRIEQVGLAAGKSRAEIAQLQADASSKVNARHAQEQKRSAQVADQVAQQSATHELALRRLVDADALASVRDRVQRSVLSQEQGIAEVARIEREAALKRAADLSALAQNTKDPVKRDKAMQDAALARREAFNIEQQALRETAALREKHQQAYQESLNAAVAQEMKRAESLSETARALGLQTEQARENGLVIDSVATILAREEASRYAVAAASTEQALAAALARQAGEQEVAALRKQLELLQRLAEQKSGVASASAATDLRQAALDQTKRLFGQSNPFETWGQTLRDTFGQGGDGLARMVSSMGQLTTAAQDYAREMSVIKELRDSGDDENRKTADENELKLIKRTEAAQIGAYASMASAAKGYFGKQTAAYKVLHAAEVGLRTYQLVSAVAANSKEIGAIASKVAAWVTGEATMTTTAIAGSQARVVASVAEGQAVAAVGVANQAKGDPYSAWFRMAAMAATMATLGFALSGGARARAAAPTNEGKGTVLGDNNAPSESFANALELLNRTQDEMLIYTREMTSSLRSIDAALGGATNVYLRGGGVSGLTNTIATGKMDTGLSSLMGKVYGSIPLVGGILKSVSSALFGKKVSIVGSGISAGAQSLGNIVNNGFEGNYYADVNTTKKFFGIKTSSRTRTQYSDMDPTLERQFASVFQGIYTSIGSAAMALEQDMDVIGARLNAAVVDIGRVDLQGLDGKAIAERLSAVFGAQADRLAGSVIPGFEALQKVGEGYYETLIRVANQYETVNLYTARLGDALGATGITGAKAADALIKAFGGMDGYVDSVKQFYEDFYSEQERAARMSVELGQVFSRLGLSVPTTMSAYRDLVNAQDLTTESGRKTYSALLALGPAFANVANQALEAKKKIDDERADLQDQLDRLTGNTTAIRARELAALDESNRALQKRIWALQDEKEVAEFAASAGGRIVDFVSKLDAGSLGLGSAIERVGSVRVQYEAQLAAARRGDKTALEGITNSASDYLQAARDSAANQLDYSIKLAQVKSDLSLLPAARTYMEQLGESQLKVMGQVRDGTDQMRALLAEMKEISMVQAATLASNTQKNAQRQEDLLRFWERLEQDGVFDAMGSGT